MNKAAPPGGRLRQIARDSFRQELASLETVSRDRESESDCLSQRRRRPTQDDRSSSPATVTTMSAVIYFSLARSLARSAGRLAPSPLSRFVSFRSVVSVSPVVASLAKLGYLSLARSPDNPLTCCFLASRGCCFLASPLAACLACGAPAAADGAF